MSVTSVASRRVSKRTASRGMRCVPLSSTRWVMLLLASLAALMMRL